MTCLLVFCAVSAFAASPEQPAVEKGSSEQMAAGLVWECTPDPSLPNVLLLGDSISIGYTLQVRELLKGKANVYRPLKSGKPLNCFTAENGIASLSAWVGTQKWSVIHFNFGLHDLKYVNGTKLDKVGGTQVSTVEGYKKNLDTLVPLLQKTGAKLIFATTTIVPAGEGGRVEGDEKRYNEAALEVMKKYGVAVNDLHALTSTFPPELFKKPANVHYSEEGSARLAKQVAGSVLQALQN